VVVEAPEVKCPTLLLPSEFPVHIRLHCPNALVEAHNGWPVHWGEFAEEMEVVRSARVVSSPSYALVRALEGYLETDAVHVYKNPPPWGVAPDTIRAAKKRDLVYLTRFSPLKGSDALVRLLLKLPGDMSVALAGRESDRFSIPSATRCGVTLLDEITGRARLRFLSEGRMSLTLSRFENCSMTILESLAVGTVVAGWRVGGNEEIADPRLIRLVARDDVEALVQTIQELRQQPYPSSDEFRVAIANLRDDFRQGWQHAWTVARQQTPASVYRGMDVSGQMTQHTADDLGVRDWLRRVHPMPGMELGLSKRQGICG
jgi:glycosyltransferase involved in cell wall biosynthesis